MSDILHTDGPDIQAVLIVVVMAALVGYVGLQVFVEIDQEQLESSEFAEHSEYIQSCPGSGCTGTYDLIPVTGIAGVLAVIIGYLMSVRAPPDDDLHEVKKLYVDGEIGILELEERLDDEMENDE